MCVFCVYLYTYINIYTNHFFYNMLAFYFNISFSLSFKLDVLIILF